MKLPKYLLILIALLPFFATAQLQEENTTVNQALKEEKIEGQFDMVIKKSGRYQDYKVVKRVWLDKLKGNTIDTIKTLESKLKATNLEISEQKATINGLQESLAKTNENLTSVTEEKDNMSFFGAAVTKSSYKTIMWVIIGALLALLTFFIFRFKNSNTITVQAKKALAETEAEFEDHRRRALEREQKVMRKLQDEINKQRKAGAK
ncbi:tRNA (guanine-N1)-methyltransferase [Aquimarina sp. 2201CG5-10]|uniref:tRNA (guanine-N1)-methyltransferase n=1 Tax=Aquimarina callyspongiae TaxID=3098150 RepID=UPI002AB3C7C8|nr:tRNA (guanine-N1)-methyltransferase [Aquimarina sp. 2201CG5-10]MDY8138297.1 tRNA (guanine-N1)-methyltransferase [Aquimarina sp. 2201CG5-10]